MFLQHAVCMIARSVFDLNAHYHINTMIACSSKGLEPHKRVVRLERDGNILNVNEGRYTMFTTHMAGAVPLTSMP